MKPFLKWVGGKRKLVPIIRELIPSRYGKYHEPFLGGGALFFDMLPKHSYLYDVNYKLITTYIEVRNNVEDVISCLREMKHNEATYTEARRRNFLQGTNAQRAADFIYCNRVGFNGLFRENKKGQFNVPFGKYENPRICDEEGLRETSKALRNGANILPASFETSLDHTSPGDVWYADPPYVPLSETSSFTSFSSGGFTTADQIKLRDVAVALRDRGVHVILSNSSAPLVRDLYGDRGFRFREVRATRAVNSNGEGRGPVTELLIY